MKFFDFLFSHAASDEPESTTPDLGVNPANGLPMIEGTWLDIEGNTYGTDSHGMYFDTQGSGVD